MHILAPFSQPYARRNLSRDVDIGSIGKADRSSDNPVASGRLALDDARVDLDGTTASAQKEVETQMGNRMIAAPTKSMEHAPLSHLVLAPQPSAAGLISDSDDDSSASSVDIT